MSQEQLFSRVADRLRGYQDAMIADWATLVDQGARADEEEPIARTAALLAEMAEKAGIPCTLIPTGERTPPVVVGTTRNAPPGAAPIVFGGHYDTVFTASDSLARPFRIEGDKAFGPGVLDMKGGIVMSLYIIRAFLDAGYDEHPFKIIYCGDEEPGHPDATTVDVLRDEARGGLFAFNMETGRDPDNLCVGRRGVCDVSLVVHGRGAHSGNDFAKGIHAIEELAHKIIAMHKLNPPDLRYTVSANVVRGGTVPNAIPAKAECDIDIRFPTQDDLNHIRAELQRIADHNTVPGATGELIWGTRLDAFETTGDVLRLHDFVRESSRLHGLPERGRVVVGGGSDACYIAGAGVPVLCSCGVRGLGSHTEDEYAFVDSMVDNSLTLAAAIANASAFRAGQ